MDIRTFSCAMNVASCPHLLPLLCLPTSCDNYHCWRFRVYTSNNDNLNVNHLFQFVWFAIICSTFPFYFSHTPSPFASSISTFHLHLTFSFCILVSWQFCFFFHMCYKLSTTILMFFAIVSSTTHLVMFFLVSSL